MAAFLCVAHDGTAQSTPQRSLLALSKRAHTLAIVDPATLQVIARAPVGPDPHEVIASADGRTAYVSIYGFGRYHTLSVIDLVAQKALPDIDTGALNGPHGLTWVGGKVWFTAEGAKAIARYDPATSKVDWIMGTGQNRTHMIYVTARREADLHDKRQLRNRHHFGEGRPAAHGASPRDASADGVPPPPPPGGGQPRIDWNETVVPVGKGDEGFDVIARRSRVVDCKCAGWHAVDHRYRKQTSDGHAGRQDLRRQPAQIHSRWQACADLQSARRQSCHL